MKTAVINIKTEPKLKKEASKLASEIGLNLSQVIHISLQNFVISGTITASRPEQMSPKLERELAQVEKDAKTGKNMSPVFRNAKDMDAYLDNLK